MTPSLLLLRLALLSEDLPKIRTKPTQKLQNKTENTPLESRRHFAYVNRSDRVPYTYAKLLSNIQFNKESRQTHLTRNSHI